MLNRISNKLSSITLRSLIAAMGLLVSYGIIAGLTIGGVMSIIANWNRQTPFYNALAIVAVGMFFWWITRGVEYLWSFVEEDPPQDEDKNNGKRNG